MSTTARERRRDLCILAVLAAAMLLTLLTVRNTYYISLLTYAAVYSIAALGLFLLFGYAGQISLAQAAFFGIGAYVAAYFSQRTGVPHLLILAAAAVLPAAVGWLVSHHLLRLTTNYLAMATLAFGTICFIIFSQARSITGGLDPGVIGVPAFDLFGFRLDSPARLFGLVAVCLLLTLLATINIVHSRIGRGLRALRTSEVAAAGLGVDVVNYKRLAFAVSAGMTGLAGALFAWLQTTFNAGTFNVGLSIELLLMVVIGSVFTPWGALFGAAFITILPAFLEGFEQYKHLIYGVVMTFAMIFVPDGLGKAAVDALVHPGRLRRRE